ncbi:pentapeptide repeat-containing protein [Candidatus Uabimicrobium sp. HlEnr_7]|uniref:pentapeptide repeat-containing protein n=1 Tax=Candidatus Uabimicrobium helgolandensis TaxID=3095367 RepID=UPI00355631BB
MTNISVEENYDDLVTELRICRTGGLFLAFYQDECVANAIICKLKKELGEQFQFELEIDKHKMGFPLFFEQTFEQLGEKSNIFHVTGTEKLNTSDQDELIKHLQYGRERFKSKPYSLVFWINSKFSKKLFELAPDFYHWLSGTYDFSNVDIVKAHDTKENEQNKQKLRNYYQEIVRQYENWQQIKDQDQDFLVEVMGRANICDYYIESNCIDQKGQEWTVNNFLKNFIEDDSKNFLTLLGDFGIGKTSFSLQYFVHLAKEYLKSDKNRMPIFISLREYKGKINIEKLIVREFYDRFGIQISFDVFQEFALQGKFVFFVDGFDEMASLSNSSLTTANFKELTKLTFENTLFLTKKFSVAKTANKVFLTCRTHYFFNEIQEKKILTANYTVLYRNYATKSNYQVGRLQLKEFSDEQIEEYVAKVTKNKTKTQETLKIIRNTYNLQELSERPLLLDMIVKTLPALKSKQEINVAALYQTYTDIWIGLGDWRAQMKPEGKRKFMWQLAIQMIHKGGDFSLHYSELTKPEEKYLKDDFNLDAEDYYQYETTTCSFLNRDQEGYYKFIHKSFMEYFLAENYFDEIVNGHQPTIKYSDLGTESQFFLKFVISIHRKNLQQLDLSEFDLQNINLRSANLQNAKLQNSNLANTDLTCADLQNALLTEANLQGAVINKANLQKVNLEKANLNFARIIMTNFSYAKLQKACLQNAYFLMVDMQKNNLQGANLSNSNLSTVNLQGANFAEANLTKVVMQNVNLNDVNFCGANLKEIHLQENTLKNAKMDNCSLVGANLVKTDFAGSSMTYCQLDNANLYKANLIGANIHGSTLNGVNITGVSIYRLKGTVFSMEHVLCEYLYLDKQTKNFDCLLKLQKFFFLRKNYNPKGKNKSKSRNRVVFSKVTVQIK